MGIAKNKNAIPDCQVNIGEFFGKTREKDFRTSNYS